MYIFEILVGSGPFAFKSHGFVAGDNYDQAAKMAFSRLDQDKEEIVLIPVGGRRFRRSAADVGIIEAHEE